MYAGHAAIALVLKARDPRVPIIPLTLACYGPDWIDMALMIPRARAGMAPYSHSIPAVLTGALVASGLYALVVRRPGTLSLLIGWLLHWPADLFTATKPIVNLHWMIGLDLYHLPIADFLLETLVVVAACLYYARRRDPDSRQRRALVRLGGALILMQLVFITHIAMADRSPWRPSLARQR